MLTKFGKDRQFLIDVFAERDDFAGTLCFSATFLRSGGISAVYEAKGVRFKNRLVALKKSFADDNEARQPFEREAESPADIVHDVYPCVINYFTDAGGCFPVRN